MVQQSINALQLWNTSKQVASTAYDVHIGELSFEEFKDAHDTEFIPFNDETDIEAVVTTVEEPTRDRVVTVLQRHIHDTVKQDLTLTNTGLNVNTSGLQLSNRARTAAKDLLNHVETSDVEHDSTTKNTDAYESLIETHGELLPNSETEVVKLIQSLESEQRWKQFNELTRELIKIATEPDTEDSQADSQIRSIAEDLATLFIDREYTTYNSYSEITNAYDDVVFPSRDVSMMKVVNATGETRDERVESIVEWVTEWFMNPEHAQELSTRRRAPMGMAGRGD